MLNEPLIEILIEIFTKCYKFILRQIINGFEWRLCSFHKINGLIIWLMFGQGAQMIFFKHVLEFLTLKRSFMRM